MGLAIRREYMLLKDAHTIISISIGGGGREVTFVFGDRIPGLCRGGPPCQGDVAQFHLHDRMVKTVNPL